MAGGRRPRRVRVGHDVRHPDAPVSRAAAHRDDASDGQSRAGQRLRRLGRYAGRLLCAVDAAICAGRAPSGRRVSHRELHERALADLGIRDAGRRARSCRRFWSSTAPARSSSSGRSSRATVPSCLRVRPFLSGRDYHSMHHENGAFRFDAERKDATVTFRPYDGLAVRRVAVERRLPACAGLVSALPLHARNASAAWTPSKISRRRASSAGRCRRQASRRSGSSCAALRFLRETSSREAVVDLHRAMRCGRDCRGARRFATPLDRAADAYLVRRGAGSTIVAGYPWFTDWGRDTFIAVRGLCLATGRLSDARDILVEWAGAVSEGMLPNRFPDHGEAPEFNSVDASLWYVVAAHELLQLGRAANAACSLGDERRALETRDPEDRGRLRGRHAIRHPDGRRRPAGRWRARRAADLDGRARRRSRDHASHRKAGRDPGALAERAQRRRTDWIRTGVSRSSEACAAFAERFWNEERGHLADVVDVDHVPGTRDDTCRPNQILAVGGLPVALLDGERARRIVECVEQRLLTPLGLRSLAPGEPGYAPRYEGDSVGARRGLSPGHRLAVADGAVRRRVGARPRQHGGRARRGPRTVHRAAAARISSEAGLGHVSEIADAEAPFTPRGCPFQAWSLGELLRLDRVVLSDPRRERSSSGRRGG